MSDASAYITVPEIDERDILTVDDPYFTPDNVALVTGAASGVGRATSIALAANGLTVVPTDIDEEGLTETVDIAEEFGLDGRLDPVVGDLTSDEDLREMVDYAAAAGSIKFLANIAGMQHVDAIENFPMDVYDTMMEVLLRSPVYLSKLCIPHMKESEEGVGCVGNVSSVNGHYAPAKKVAYNCGKFGIRGLTQSIAAEGEGRIRSFSISPGPIRTPHLVNQIPDIAEEEGISIREAVEDEILSNYRVKEMIDPITVGNYFTVGFSEMGKYVDGGDFLIDGGASLTY